MLLLIYLEFKKTKLKKFYEFETSGAHFLFQGTFYDLIDGVAMPRLGPILSYLFMRFMRN